MEEKEFLAIVANDLLSMAINKEADFSYVPSVMQFIVDYTGVTNE
jgi:hypothetical protein